jgi:hypothetical protein
MTEYTIEEKVKLLMEVAPSEYEFKLNPVATEEELIIFETQFKVKIPEDYRWFVLNIANGIDSKYPYVQITSENDFADYFYEADQYNPAIPFNVSERVRFESETIKDVYDFPYKTTFDPEHTLFDGIFNGWVNVGIDELLIVNGVEYGNMWVLDVTSNNEVRPMYNEAKNLQRIGFTEWVEKRLDYYIFRFINKLPLY